MLTKNERIEAIKEEITEIGLLTLSKTNLAKKYGVSRTTIHNDVKKAILDIDPDSINVNKFIVDDSFKRSLLKVNKIIENSSNTQEMLQSIEIQRRLLDSYSNFLEKLNLNTKSSEDEKDDNRLPKKININVVHGVHDAENMDDDKWEEVCKEREKKRLENGSS